MRETALKVSFELSARDVRYFRGQLKVARKSRGQADDDALIQSAIDVVSQARASDPPEFVLVRIAKLELFIRMMTDADWRLEGRDRTRVLDALAYFADPDDMIHDGLPGIGYLDDAIMVELIARELVHEIKAYEDFCEFRARQAGRAGDADPASTRLKSRRDALQARMRRRRRRERDDMRDRRKKSSLRLW